MCWSLDFNYLIQENSGNQRRPTLDWQIFCLEVKIKRRYRWPKQAKTAFLHGQTSKFVHGNVPRPTPPLTGTRTRFQKDPFSTRSILGCPHISYVNPETPFTRTWIDPRKRASTWKARPVCFTCRLTETDSPRAQIALFCLFHLLASGVLLYCFMCLCPEEGVYVVCESWRQVIKERLQRQNETQTKDEAKWNKNKTPDLRLRRRQGRVASEDNSNHPPFCFPRQLPSKQKEMSCYRFRQRDCKCTWSNIHRLGKPFLIALQKRSGYHAHTQKRSGSETSVFEKSTFGSVFESSVLGPGRFQKALDTWGYVWPFLCIRGRKAPFSKRPGYVCT